MLYEVITSMIFWAAFVVDLIRASMLFLTMKAPSNAPTRAPDMINNMVVTVMVIAPTSLETVLVPQKREKSTPYRYRSPAQA